MTASPELDQQPIPRSRSPFGLGFRQPEPATELPPSHPTPSPATSSPAEDAAAAPASDPGWLEESDPSDESGDTRSTASSTEQKVANPLVGNALRDTFRNGIIIASEQVHRVAVRTQGQLETGLYRADEDDAANIGDPLARIAGRRDGLGQVSPDTADLMASLMGLAGYASKQIQRQAIAAKIDARNAAAETLPPADV